MELIIYSGFSKKPNSTKQPTGGTVHEVHLKNGCSVMNPVFQIDGIDLTANYCKWNNRYYYIDDIVLSNNSIYELHCSVDVLSSWKTQILQSNQYVTRSTFSFDGKIADNRYAMKAEPVKEVYSYTQGTGTNLPTALSEGYYVCSCIGLDAGQTGQSSFLVFSKSNLQNFMSELVEACAVQNYNWTNFIRRVMYFPMLPQGTTSISQVKIGKGVTIAPINVSGWVITGLAYEGYAENTLPKPNHPQAASRGSWLNGSIATSGKLIYGPIGEIDLPVDLILSGTTATYRMKFDYMSGGARFEILIDGAVVRAIDLSSFGVDTLVANQQTNAIGALGSLAGAVANAGAGNFLGAGSSIISAIELNRGKPESIGSNGSRAKFASNVNIVYEYKLLSDENHEDQGRPLCQNRTLSQLTGYVECANVHPDFPATPAEKDQLITFLENGIFLE